MLVYCQPSRTKLTEIWIKIIFFFPHNFISPYLHFFVTTRQSSTYKQSTSDSEIRKLDCIRTLVTWYDNETHNNAPKATGNGLKQCGTAITQSIFFKFSQQTTHILPIRGKVIYFQKIYLKKSSAKCWPSCSSLNMLKKLWYNECGYRTYINGQLHTISYHVMSVPVICVCGMWNILALIASMHTDIDVIMKLIYFHHLCFEKAQQQLWWYLFFYRCVMFVLVWVQYRGL